MSISIRGLLAALLVAVGCYTSGTALGLDSL
jgi:hypothetical protein